MKKPVITDFIVTEITENLDLKKLLPEVDNDSKEQLKALIEAEGIREPLTIAVIDGDNVLLDGHNRLRVAKELGYMSVSVVFNDEIKDIVQAEIWMIHNQLARRNMSDMERIQVILKLEPELKAQAKARQAGDMQNSAQVGKVVQIIADMADVSRNTINQAKAILATGDADLIAITDKEISFNKAFKYAGFPEEKRKAKIQAVIQKVSTKAEETTVTEEEEKIYDNGYYYTKITDLSYCYKADEKYTIIRGYKLVNDKHKLVSDILITDYNFKINIMPNIPVGDKAGNIFTENGDDKVYNEIVNDIRIFMDNIKTAKRLTDPARIKVREKWLEAHPEPKAPKPPTASEIKKADKIEKEKAEAQAKAEKERSAFGLLTATYQEFYATLKKKDQKAVLAIIYATEPEATKDALTVALNGYGYVAYLEKQAEKTAKTAHKAPKTAKAPATAETPTPAPTEAPEPIPASTNKKSVKKADTPKAKAKTPAPAKATKAPAKKATKETGKKSK